MKHTQTPWQIQTTDFGYTTIFDTEGRTIISTNDRKQIPDFERILECVNAMEGIASPCEFMIVPKATGLDIFAEHEALKLTAKKLAMALGRCTETLNDVKDIEPEWGLRDELKQAKTALMEYRELTKNK